MGPLPRSAVRDRVRPRRLDRTRRPSLRGRGGARQARVPDRSERAAPVHRVSSVAVLGLGAMGSRVAHRLVETRHDVVVWNRSPEKAHELVAAGATGAETPAEAARQAQTVITLVADPPALAAVTEGQDGLAAGSDHSTTVVNMSTVGPAAVERLAAVLPS